VDGAGGKKKRFVRGKGGLTKERDAQRGDWFDSGSAIVVFKMSGRLNKVLH